METIIEGINCYKSLAELPDEVKSISIITPPSLTEKLLTKLMLKVSQISGYNPKQSELAIQKCHEVRY